MDHMKGTLSEKFCLVGISMVQILMSMYVEDSRMTMRGMVSLFNPHWPQISNLASASRVLG